MEPVEEGSRSLGALTAAAVNDDRFMVAAHRFLAILMRWCSRHSLQTQPCTYAALVPCCRSSLRSSFGSRCRTLLCGDHATTLQLVG